MTKKPWEGIVITPELIAAVHKTLEEHANQMETHRGECQKAGSHLQERVVISYSGPNLAGRANGYCHHCNEAYTRCLTPEEEKQRERDLYTPIHYPPGWNR